MNIYHEIVFMQGEEATEPLALLDESHNKCLNYLCQWDLGREMEHSPKTEPPWGTDDNTIRMGGYIINSNHRLGYIGLIRVQTISIQGQNA